MNLEECRVKIDEIDRRIVKLLEARMDVVREVARNKAMTGMPVLDEAREAKKLRKIRRISKGSYSGYNAEAFRDIMAVSRRYQTEHPVKYGLLGEHLGHSFSPEIHKALGGYDYFLFEVAPGDLGKFMKENALAGMNVTIPYKKAVIPFLDELSPAAAKIGSVNTVVRRSDGSLMGDNTDYYGFMKMVELAGIDVTGAKAIVLGDGGVAPTVRLALEDMGAREIVTISRRGENNYTNLGLHADAEIIVNTTPVGMYPDNGSAVISVGDFPVCRGVIDLIYNPLKTRLMLDAEELGIPTSCGLDMLVYQAAAAVTLFTGKDVADKKVLDYLEKLKAKQGNVVLIGMPGSGKSSVGKALARKLKLQFIDTDVEIQKREGVPPGEIIRSEGEAAFREIESSVIRELGAMHGMVIATGGGAVTRPENYQPLAQNGTIVYINRSIEELATAGRPLSQARSPQVLFEERHHLYEGWNDIEVPVQDSPGETADEIIRLL